MECYFLLLDWAAYQLDAIFLGPRSKCPVIGPQTKQQKAQIAQVNTAELYVRRANINIFRTCTVICTVFLHFMIFPSVSSSSTLFSLPSFTNIVFLLMSNVLVTLVC